MSVMSSQTRFSFPNVQTYGQLLPSDTLWRIIRRDKAMPGLEDKDYHLVAGERLNEAINRSWQKMRNVWHDFSRSRETLSRVESGTSQTREGLLLPLFQELGYGRLSLARAAERIVTLPDGTQQRFPISHFRDESPIHLVSFRQSLDKREGSGGNGLRQSPHSLVQEFLNLSDRHLWGFVSNGLSLRILRDNVSLSQQACVDFNLAGIFEEESFSEFALLWMCCHHSRVHVDNEPPERCWLEIWSSEAHTAAVAALGTLRNNVRACLETLGQGFIEANPELNNKLVQGKLDRMDYFRQLLRLAYRLVFLFVIEERDLLHPASTSTKVRDRYARFWSLSRLRDLAQVIHGSEHYDLWEGVKLVMRALAGPESCPFLGIQPMGGFLWSERALPDITSLRLRNSSLLKAMRQLAFTMLDYQRRPVDWRHLGARELGSVYESLLELQPEISDASFVLTAKKGNDRKTTGSYYTPDMLIELLLDSALEPVIAKAEVSENPEKALLTLKICDPACGSGHFLIAAARRVAKRLAVLRTQDREPSPQAQRQALRDVVSCCIYGIDINPMSVELCKLGLWMETYEPGKPLTFLDHRVICANTLIGATSEAIEKGIPEGAYTPLDGDNRKAAFALKKRNMGERKRLSKELLQEYKTSFTRLKETVRPLHLESMPADTVAEMARREAVWLDWRKANDRMKFVYDLWTAAFVLPPRFLTDKEKPELPDGTPNYSGEIFGVTLDTLIQCVSNTPLDSELVKAVENASRDCQFFHLEVTFPEVAARNGFDVVLANPPWEHDELKEKEWFTAHNREDIAYLPGDRRKQAIENLASRRTDSDLYTLYQKDLRNAQVRRKFYAHSGNFPLCARGRINLYSVFAEWMRSSINDTGRLGCIVPSGIASDDTTRLFFQDLINKASLFSLYDFENKGIFADVDSRFKFSLLTASSGRGQGADKTSFVFFAHASEDLRDPEKAFTLSPQDFELLNPNTRTCPIFCSTRDAALTKAVYRRVPVLLRKGETGRSMECNPWELQVSQGLFNMTTGSALFRTKVQLEQDGWTLNGNVFTKGSGAGAMTCLPLYEAKMIHQFTHRWSTYTASSRNAGTTRDVSLEELRNAEFYVQPRYWVAESEVREKLQQRGWPHEWLMGWRDITNVTNRRTIIGTVFPLCAVGHKLPLFFVNAENVPALQAMLASFVADYCCRQKLGGTSLSFNYLYQIPILTPQCFASDTCWQPGVPLKEWIRQRVVELVYTAEDMRPFARDMGFEGEPLGWDQACRFQRRVELDAAFFHLYLPANTDGTWKQADGETQEQYNDLVALFPTPRHAVEYIMETFPIVRNKDIERFGTYRTRDAILKTYDAFAASAAAYSQR